MIELTPLDVRQKKDDLRRGARSLRGYAPAEVDTFFDIVAERLEQLVKENMVLADSLASLEHQLEEHREREKGLTDALVALQEHREQVERQAARDAELTRRAAEIDAAKFKVAAAEAREKEETALRQLSARRAQLMRSYRLFLERELAELQAMADVLERDVDGVLEEGGAAASGDRDPVSGDYPETEGDPRPGVEDER